MYLKCTVSYFKAQISMVVVGYNINIEVCIHMHKSKRNVVSPRDSIRMDFGSLDAPGISQLLPREELGAEKPQVILELFAKNKSNVLTCW